MQASGEHAGAFWLLCNAMLHLCLWRACRLKAKTWAHSTERQPTAIHDVVLAFSAISMLPSDTVHHTLNVLPGDSYMLLCSLPKVAMLEALSVREEAELQTRRSRPEVDVTTLPKAPASQKHCFSGPESSPMVRHLPRTPQCASVSHSFSYSQWEP
jgi:hypothetical protein